MAARRLLRHGHERDVVAENDGVGLASWAKEWLVVVEERDVFDGDGGLAQ